ncbi:YodC family protein [Rhodopseudomonas sp. P2A-2r]|uniref:YodC family protein n=1 Tax=Rhodopseudomonas sp. P2A-2r TaxID=2991972 RepID=UPI0022344F37|nr:YodC family protein [Rhodopseudomonas sp. P2A-2r]UZE48831.1 YodC family protein [Rhodopseudomonas sp. P2A-2r]
MDLRPGDVVMLKSGGHPLTVAEVNQTSVVCMWMGDEGDLFRETLPLAVLEVLEVDETDETDDEEEDEEDESAKVA